MNVWWKESTPEITAIQRASAMIGKLKISMCSQKIESSLHRKTLPYTEVSFQIVFIFSKYNLII